jgi:leucyl aminopeptidase
MAALLTPAEAGEAIPIHLAPAAAAPGWDAGFESGQRAFLAALGFRPGSGKVALLPGASGGIGMVVAGLDGATDPFLPGRLVRELPAGRYRFATPPARPELAALSWLLSAYRFTRYKAAEAFAAELVVAEGVDAAAVTRQAEAVARGRDLVNTPASDMGPSALAAAAAELARRHRASCRIVGGEELAAGFPMVHAVGRAAAEAPRLVDITFGDEDLPKVTLVGKGVCFDTGGLDIKPDAAMLLMKKDMGGAAAAIAAADMILGEALPVRLRLILPIVENAISAASFRPGDVLASRKGLTVEIGNTDAEGRLILADALALADEDHPDLLVDYATLTGAARVALGPDLPPYYTGDERLAAEIAEAAAAVHDPLWRLPLWSAYDGLLDSKIADMNNVASGGMAGSIIAALFLRRFVQRAKAWAHVDLYAWNPALKPGRPEGGEIQAARMTLELVRRRFCR